MSPRLHPLRTLLFALFAWSALAASIGRADPLRWRAEVEALVKHAPAEKGGVVFVGSSSIRMWKTLAADFPDCRVFNHGFGGSHLEDSVYYFDRLVRPFAPAVVVLYAGENDVAAGVKPERVLADFQAFRRLMREALPAAKLVCLSLKLSPSRAAHRDATVRTNSLLAAECGRDPRCVFVDVCSPMLDAAGQPRGELFLADRLHMNAAGYAIWTERVRPAVATRPASAGAPGSSSR